LRGQNDLRSPSCGLPYQVPDPGDVHLRVVRERRLNGGHNNFAHPFFPLAGRVPLSLDSAAPACGPAGTCWVMQWNEPPPVTRWSARSPTVRRVGKADPMASTAASSHRLPYTGTTTVV